MFSAGTAYQIAHHLRMTGHAEKFYLPYRPIRRVLWKAEDGVGKGGFILLFPMGSYLILKGSSITIPDLKAKIGD